MEDSLMSFLNERAIYLEKERLKAVRLNHLYRILKPVRYLLSVLFVFLLFVTLIIPFIFPATLAVGVLFLFLSIYNDPKEVFESKVKVGVLPEIFKKVNPSFKYFSTGYNAKTLKDSELLSKGFFANTVKIKGEDYVKGKIENIDVEFFEIQFFKEMINYGKTAGGCLLSLILIPFVFIKSILQGGNPPDIFMGIIRDTRVFYSGFFMCADFHKEFDGKVLMIPKKKEGIRNKVYEILEPKNLQKISMENPYIDDNYNIYASNAQTGYYVLSPSLINKIHIMSETEKALPIISLINGIMYFLIPWNKNFFSVDLFAKIEDGNYFLPYLEEINSFEKIIKDLNLNTRIWTKV